MFNVLSLYALPSFDSIQRGAIWIVFRTYMGGTAATRRQEAFERYTGMIVIDPGEFGPPPYYSKLSACIPQMALCIGTGNCLLSDPYTEPLNFINQVVPIPPP